MKSLQEILKETAQSTATTINLLDTVRDDEYIKDDIIYCKKCNTPRMCEGFTRMVRCICRCQAAERDKELEIAKQKERQQKLDKIKQMSLLGEKYRAVSFDNTEKHSEDFIKVYNRCKRYCEVASEVLKKGIGIYLFGTKGTGKSHLTACMANELMSKYYTVLYTNFAEISKYIRSTFNNPTETEYNFLEKLANVDFLFIDDFGTEQVTRNNQDLWLQEKTFEIINKRYNNNKPTIFTSNYSLRQLIEDRGLADKTVDRINEMCEVIKLEGNSFRRKVKEEREMLF